MNWLAFFLMLPHLKPKCLDILAPALYRGLDGLRVLSLLVICALFLRAYLREKRLPTPVSWLLGAMEAWICLVTIITHGDFVETCSLAVSVMAIVLLVDLYANRIGELLTTLMLNYEWLVYANLLTVVLMPGIGIAQDPEYNNEVIYFFGSVNWFIYLCIPAVCVAMLYLRLRIGQGRKAEGCLRAGLLIAAAYATVLLQTAATAAVALAVIAVVLLLGLIPGVRRCVYFPVVFIGGISANIAVLGSRIMEKNPLISYLIQSVLKKELTFTGRTELWDAFFLKLRGNLWMGLGTPKEGYLIFPPEVEQYVFDHMHNQMLDLLVQGGIPALLLFLSALLLAGGVLTVQRKTMTAKMITAAMAGLLVICIPEVCRHAAVFVLFPLAYHAGRIEAVCGGTQLPK